MKSLSVFSAVVVALTLGVFSASSAQSAAGGNWQTDYKAALEQAAKENRYVLLDFTGSDWCGWCIKLSKDTFSKPAFQEFADKNLVLVELDFPNNKMQSEMVITQNQELQQKFGVEGFPTLILLNPKGKEVARNVGYLQGGPEGFISWVQAAQKK